MKIFGWLLIILAGLMMCPLAFALAFEENLTTQCFLAAALINGFIGGGLVFSWSGRKVELGSKYNLLLLSVIWVFIPAFASLPFFFAGVPDTLITAYFESVSAFTTTGATIFDDLASVPHSLLVWRHFLQWFGGLATLLSLALIIAPLMGLDLLDRELRQISIYSHGMAHHMLGATKSLLPLYGGLTLICYAALIVADIPSFDAFCLALSTLSTGGLMPRDGHIGLYGSPFAQLILAFFMVVGAVSLVWVKALLQFRWGLLKQVREPVWIGLSVLALGFFLASSRLVSLPIHGIDTLFHSLTIGFAAAASFISTTGFAFEGQTEEMLPLMAILLLCFIGGGRFSTAGGIKFFRIMEMLSQSAQELATLIYPHGVESSKAQTISKDFELSYRLSANFAAIILTICAFALIISTMDMPLSGAFIASISMISNVGPAYNLIVLPEITTAPSYSEMGSLVQIILCVGMILGRVELLALFSLLNFIRWRS